MSLNSPANTDNTFPQTGFAEPQPKKKKRGLLKFGLGAAAVLIIGGALINGGDSAPSETTAQESTIEQVNVEAQPAPEMNAEVEPVADSTPLEFRNALRSAENYLRISGFSEAGLRDQLTSEFGEAYPAEAADYALANLEVDWNEQAVKSAEAYQEIMPMSRTELIDQLSSEYGDKYTVEQATYAVDQLGL